jgi:hypothetical protein
MDVIVSLTTWKGRINDRSFHKVLYRLLSQKTKYNYKVVLVLSEEEFGKNYKLPDALSIMQECERFEILWTYANTKALKKLDPTMEKYPDIPIITTDDDILLKPDGLQMALDEYKKNPKYIHGSICGTCNGIMRVGGLRIFPPHSLAHIDNKYFKQYFKCLQDDEWNGIRAALKRTGMKHLRCRPINTINYGNQNVAFSKEYGKFNFRLALKKFKKDHPEFFK